MEVKHLNTFEDLDFWTSVLYLEAMRIIFPFSNPSSLLSMQILGLHMCLYTFITLQNSLIMVPKLCVIVSLILQY